jgi:hypothetical protein
MALLGELIRQGKTEEVWQKCCGYIDLSIEDFMKIQKRLLMEQLELIKKCELGRYILSGAIPRNVKEFREQVPLTTYKDYEPYLLKRKKEVLPEKPILWQHTSGRSGEYPFKWTPLTNRQYQEMGPAMYSSILFSCCRERGDVPLKVHDKLLYALAPAPYLSGVGGRCIEEEHLLDFIPPLDDAEKMEFTDAVQEGFRVALLEGLDVFGGISILLLPRDVWKLKGLVAGGTDTTVFRERIKEMWGRYPLNVYAFTEALVVAVQTWDYQGMTFLPNLNFLEFIPEKESLKSREDPMYQPTTLLLDELNANENYELVVTNFLGGAMVRYRNGDMVRITSLRNEQLNIDIPQMEFHSRVDDLIDIAGFTRLTEGIIWQAIERSSVPCKDWTVRKETSEKQELHLYLELKDDSYGSKEDIALGIHKQLKTLDRDYANIESFLGLMPLEITLLPRNAFQAYRLRQQAAGADMARLKVPHVNASESVIDFLLNSEDQITVAGREESQRKPVGTK